MVNNKIEIIKKLIENSPNDITIHKLSLKVKIPYANVYNIVKKLENDGLIILEKRGNAYNCILKRKVHPLIFEAEYERMNVLTVNKNLMGIKSKLNYLKFPFIALIFGSYAKGIATKVSDVDLMILSEKNRIKDLERTISLLPLDIHLVPLTFEEFISMAQSKKFDVVSEVMDANVILVGIEDYYRMLENVG